MRRLLALREREGLTYGELAERAGVSRNTLSWWAWKLRREEGGGGFVELEIADAPLDASARIEVELSSGHRLRVPRDFDEEELRPLAYALVIVVAAVVPLAGGLFALSWTVLFLLAWAVVLEGGDG